jgi:hypothetical protein
MDVRVIYRTCPTCGHRFGQPDDPGRQRRLCSDVCNKPPTGHASAPPSRLAPFGSRAPGCYASSVTS